MFNNIYKDKKILVTGNSGFKGSWLTIWLLRLGAKVYGISNDLPSSPTMFEELKLEDKIEYFKADVTEYSIVNELINDIKPDFIFHLAAQSLVSVSYSDPIQTINTNVIGTANILQTLNESMSRCIGIIITSDKCYDNVEWVWGYKETDALGGKDIYSGSKGAAELIFKSYFNSYFSQKKSIVRIASARAGNVIGGGDWALDRIVPDAMKSWSKKKSVVIRNPKATRPWQHVLEPLSGYLSLGQNLYKNYNLNGQSFNFGPDSKCNYNVEDILKELSNVWGSNGNQEHFKVVDEKKFHEAGLLKLNCDKAMLELNWTPILNFNELMEFTGKWYKNFYSKKNDMFNYTMNQIEDYEKKAITQKINWAT